MTQNQRFTIFRASDAPGLMEVGHMAVGPYTDLQREWVTKAKEVGLLDGDVVKVLCDLPGFHLTYAWLKAHYPLPLHSHDADCLYYILAGDLRMGTEQLGPGDGFFVPAETAYAYTPGDQGVEVLEFRTASRFNMLNLAKGERFWAKAVETIAAHSESWRTAEPPSRTTNRARPDPGAR
jgi:hypothetical protein